MTSYLSAIYLFRNVFEKVLYACGPSVTRVNRLAAQIYSINMELENEFPASTTFLREK